ncbi:MAG: hypothetical protein Q4A63_08020 [Butyricicoccus pullicaecorum]|nr:hypothetical protein [Butyricicoccus pullicaecorum]MDO4669751.1 hypothetical protein [Butyricicoccus pullicaecorum]
MRRQKWLENPKIIYTFYIVCAVFLLARLIQFCFFTASCTVALSGIYQFIDIFLVLLSINIRKHRSKAANKTTWFPIFSWIHWLLLTLFFIDSLRHRFYVREQWDRFYFHNGEI